MSAGGGPHAAKTPQSPLYMANYVLEILDGDRAGEVLPVADRLLRIGRKPGNDIVLADEKTSGVHCEIAPEGDRLVLKDLGSTNGTFLDGKRITEIVLTPGDVVTVGRLRVKFRSEHDSTAAPGGESDEFAIRKLDAARLQRRGGSFGLVVVLLLLLGGAGGWYWWDSQQDGPGGEQGGRTAEKKAALRTPGNRLASEVADCEAADGWQLLAAGAGFRTTGNAHSGDGAFVALRETLADDAGGESGEAAAPADFALMRLAEPIKVFAGRSLVVAAHLRTRGGAQVAVRARVSSDNAQVPFEYVSGAALAERDDWQKVDVDIAVPNGCDRLIVEVVALLPTDDAEAYVDDLAVVEGGAAKAREERLESGQTALGFGSALTVRSTDVDHPATLLRLLPSSVPAPLRALHRAGLCVFSDLGVEVRCTAAERSFAISTEPATPMQFALPADAAGGLLVDGGDGAGDAGFRSASATGGVRRQPGRARCARDARDAGLRIAADADRQGRGRPVPHPQRRVVGRTRARLPRRTPARRRVRSSGARGARRRSTRRRSGSAAAAVRAGADGLGTNSPPRSSCAANCSPCRRSGCASCRPTSKRPSSFRRAAVSSESPPGCARCSSATRNTISRIARRFRPCSARPNGA